MTKTIKVNENILSENDKLALKIRKKLNENNIFSINVMASPGAGKTSLINQTIENLKRKHRVAVIDGDVVDVDLKKMAHHGVPTVLANTGGACHMDAVMMEKAIASLPLSEINLLIVENVGNLICPASFDLGTHKSVVIASVPEGDDKPYKYPAMFKGADILILNKADYLKHENFDIEYFLNGVKQLNDKLEFFMLSCKTLKGIDQWLNWVEKHLLQEFKPNRNS